MNQTIITSLIVAGLPVLAALAGLLYQYLLQKLPEQKRLLVGSIANDVVAAVEQANGEMAGGEKKVAAVAQTDTILKSLGVSVPEALVDTAIEAAVFALNLYRPRNMNDTEMGRGREGSIINPSSDAIPSPYHSERSEGLRSE